MENPILLYLISCYQKIVYYIMFEYVKKNIHLIVFIIYTHYIFFKLNYKNFYK